MYYVKIVNISRILWIIDNELGNEEGYVYFLW